jgi:single-stranded DNA-binding protein
MNGSEAAFIARVVTEPELKTSQAGKAWTAFSACVSDGDDAPWVKVVAFGDRAQQLAGHLHKGDRIYAEGRLKLEAWTAKDGQQRTGIKVSAWKVERLGETGKNTPVKPKSPPEGEHRVPPSSNGGHRQARPVDEIHF